MSKWFNVDSSSFFSFTFIFSVSTSKFFQLSSGKESACNAGDTGDVGLIPGSGRSPGEGNGYPLWFSCLENSMDRGAWWAIVHGITKSWTQVRPPHPTHTQTH